VLDLTSRGPDPWVRFSPFWPHGGIPVPLSDGRTGASVEGIWQALKVFETAGVDESKLGVTTMRGLKRTARRLGAVRGHRAGLTRRAADAGGPGGQRLHQREHALPSQQHGELATFPSRPERGCQEYVVRGSTVRVNGY